MQSFVVMHCSPSLRLLFCKNVKFNQFFVITSKAVGFNVKHTAFQFNLIGGYSSPLWHIYFCFYQSKLNYKFNENKKTYRNSI